MPPPTRDAVRVLVAGIAYDINRGPVSDDIDIAVRVRPNVPAAISCKGRDRSRCIWNERRPDRPRYRGRCAFEERAARGVLPLRPWRVCIVLGCRIAGGAD